jgi:uncharacterized membrane protein (DUF4010 family)
MTQQELFSRCAAALAIGILVGMERERAQRLAGHKLAAGMRTHAFMGLLGCIGALVADEMDAPMVFVVLIGALCAFQLAAYVFVAREGRVGLTSEVSALVTILAGTLCYLGHLSLAFALAVAALALLSLKTEMHRFARSVTREDIYASLQFAVVTAIVLPLLPHRGLGAPPLDVLNPYKIWLMVVLISGLSFAGYLFSKLLGAKRGVILTGLLGGLASSTAVTLGLTRRSREADGLAKSFALAIMLAWTVMFVRLVVAVGVLNLPLARELLLPMGASLVVGVAYCAHLYFSQRETDAEEVVLHNPFDLGPALKFGLLYAAILLVARVAQMYLGNTGLYISSLVAGLADADAISLTVADLQLLPGGPDLTNATRAVVLAAMANTATKGVIVIASGSRELRLALAPGFVLMLLAGISVAFLT